MKSKSKRKTLSPQQFKINKCIKKGIKRVINRGKERGRERGSLPV